MADQLMKMGSVEKVARRLSAYIPCEIPLPFTTTTSPALTPTSTAYHTPESTLDLRAPEPVTLAIMNDDTANSVVSLSELLKHPDDLIKIAALKADFTRKKAAVDAQLKLGLAKQLQLTQQGMSSLHNGQATITAVKAEMAKIDRLGAEAKGLIERFPEINAVAQAHRNFTAVESMQESIEHFESKLNNIMQLLSEDDQDLENQPNLLQIHFGISQLRNIKEDAMDQIKRAKDTSLEETLSNIFRKLDDAVDDFDEHMGQACINLIPLVQSGNSSMVVRLAVVIEEEEKLDMRIKELQEAQREFKDYAGRFKALASGPHELRGYKDKMLEAIKIYGQGRIDAADAEFMEEPDKLEKWLRPCFNDLMAVKQGMVPLMPKKWHIFNTYVQTYHQLIFNWLSRRSKDDEIAPTHMLAIIHWKDKYVNKMRKLGVDEKDMEPALPGGRDSDLVREYRQLITDKVDEWMNSINQTDRTAFLNRDDSVIEHRDEHGRLRTKTLPDMWRMLREQLLVASTAELSDVTEGVVDSMFRALKSRIDMWNELINAELARYSPAALASADPPALDGVPTLQDWLFALANDQIVSIADAEANFGSPGYLAAFQADYAALVSQEYMPASEEKAETLKDGITDLGFRCITVFVKLVFAIDFRAIMADFFTPAWHAAPTRAAGMGAIVTTFDDYLSDYKPALHPILADLLTVELSRKLLAAYLSAVRNKGAKFPAGSGYNDRLKDDVQAAFAFFQKHAPSPELFDEIKAEWRVLQAAMALVECDKHVIGREFAGFLGSYWDVKVGWVEALLRCRDDVEWGALGDGRNIMKGIRAEAAELRAQGRPETIMNEVD